MAFWHHHRFAFSFSFCLDFLRISFLCICTVFRLMLLQVFFSSIKKMWINSDVSNFLPLRSFFHCLCSFCANRSLILFHFYWKLESFFNWIQSKMVSRCWLYQIISFFLVEYWSSESACLSLTQKILAKECSHILFWENF